MPVANPLVALTGPAFSWQRNIAALCGLTLLCLFAALPLAAQEDAGFSTNFGFWEAHLSPFRLCLEPGCHQKIVEFNRDNYKENEAKPPLDHLNMYSSSFGLEYENRTMQMGGRFLFGAANRSSVAYSLEPPPSQESTYAAANWCYDDLDIYEMSLMLFAGTHWSTGTPLSWLRVNYGINGQHSVSRLNFTIWDSFGLSHGYADTYTDGMGLGGNVFAELEFRQAFKTRFTYFAQHTVYTGGLISPAGITSQGSSIEIVIMQNRKTHGWNFSYSLFWFVPMSLL